MNSFLFQVKKFQFIKNMKFKCFVSGTQGPDDTENNFDSKTLLNFKRILKSSNTAFKDGHTCLETECRICDTTRKTKIKGFINKTTGLYLCPNCNYKENGLNIIKLYDKDLPLNNKEQLLNKLKDSVRAVKQYQQIALSSSSVTVNEEVLKPIGITIPSTVWKNLEVTHNSSTNSLYFPLKNSAGLVVGEKILNLNNLELFDETSPKENCPGILLYSKPDSSPTSAVVVLKVIDFLALLSQKIDGVSIVCLPYWLKTLPQECLPTLEQFKELTFWFDMDNVGWDNTRNFAKKLDEKRCWFIRPTDLHPTPYEALKQQYNLKLILQKAQPILHKSITTFGSLKQDILSELQNIEKVHGVKWKRYPILNKLLKGHRKGELTVLTGPTGSGKTTFMSEYSLDLAIQGVSTLWGSFEIRNTRLAATLLRQFVGYSLEDKLDEFDFWSDQLQKLPIYFMTFHGQQSIKVVMEAIEHAQYVHDINHVIIDNVQFMMGLSSNSAKFDKFWEQDAVIAAFRTFSTRKNVHVSLVIHPRKERDSEDLTTSSIFGSAKASQEADNVLIIQDKRLTSIRGKKYLQIAKNRYSGDLGIMPLEFDKDGLSYASKKKKDIKTS